MILVLKPAAFSNSVVLSSLYQSLPADPCNQNSGSVWWSRGHLHQCTAEIESSKSIGAPEIFENLTRIPIYWHLCVSTNTIVKCRILDLLHVALKVCLPSMVYRLVQKGG